MPVSGVACWKFVRMIHSPDTKLVAWELVASTKYWVVVRRSGALNAAAFYNWYYNTLTYTSHISAQYNGTSWVAFGSTTMSFAVLLNGTAAAGTINGGSDTVVSAGWGVVGFALIPGVSSSTYTKAGYAREAA